MSGFAISTSKGQFVLPKHFRCGVAQARDRRFSFYFDPQIFAITIDKAALPTLVYNNWWGRVYVLYDKAGDKHRPAFVSEAPQAVQGNPLLVAIKRAMEELPDDKVALLYGTLRGQNRDHGPVLYRVPRPNSDERNQLLVIIQ